MISLQSKLNKKESVQTFRNKESRSKLATSSSTNAKKSSKTPLFQSPKKGFSLSKEHSIVFDRIYTGKDLFQNPNPQETEYNLDNRGKNFPLQDNLKFIGITLHHKKSENELKSEDTSQRSSSRIVIGKIRRISSEKEQRHHERKNRTPIKKLNMIEELPENSFQKL